MKDGFIKVAAATPELAVADCTFNTEQIISLMKKAQKQGSSVIVFPELCITGYCCSDLFLQDRLLEAAESSLIKIIKQCPCPPIQESQGHFPKNIIYLGCV